MKRPISHLSRIPQSARLMCWHPQADLAAYRIGDTEYLLADGKSYKFTTEQGSPAQLVSTMRTLTPREFKRCMKLLPNTFKAEHEAAEQELEPEPATA